MTSDDSARRLDMGTLESSGDPEVDRVRAVLEMRMGLGGVAPAARVGRFMVLDRVGAGAMGVVYRAYDDSLDRPVAIKVLHAELDSPSLRTRLFREARSMARLSSTNVATVFEVGEHRGRAFVAMELIRGRTLRQWQCEAAPSWREILHAYRQVAAGLAAAHGADLVHRDLKPDNAMIDDTGHVKVLDFGLARAHSPDDRAVRTNDDTGIEGAELEATPLTRTGALVGTPVYMAPELLAGEPADARSDQFAFCVALYEALYGERPFGGRTAAELAQAIRAGVPTRASRASAVPGWIRHVVVRGLAADPAARWPSMHAVAAALARDPSRSRRRWALAGVVALVVLAAFAWRRLDRARAIDGCEDAGAEIEQVWNEERANGIASVFAGTGIPYAADSAQRIDQHLRRFADEWSAARTEVCLQTEVSQSRSVELHDASVACLDERRDAVVALVDVLADAPAETMQRAVGSAASLPQIATCTDDTAMARRVALPEDPQTRAAVEALREELATATALQSAGRYRPALELARELVARADALGYAPLVAEVGFRVGLLESMVGNHEEAARRLESTLLLAGKNGVDEVAVNGYITLTWEYGLNLGRPEEGLRWGRLAEMQLARLDMSESLPAATLLRNIGSIHESQGAHDLALEHFERALAINESALGIRNTRVTTALLDIGGVYQAKSDYPRAIELMQRALDIQREILGSRHPLIGQSLHNLGLAQSELGELDRAEANYREAMSIFAEAMGPESHEVATVVHNLGLVSQYRGDLAEAGRQLERSLRMREAALGPDHPDVARSLSSLGHLAILERRFDDAIVHLERALRIEQAVSGENSPSVAIQLGYLGTTYRRRGDNARSLEYLQRALSIQEKTLGPDHINVAATLAFLAETRAATGEDDEALRLNRRSYEIRLSTLGAAHPYTIESQLGMATAELARANRSFVSRSSRDRPAPRASPRRGPSARTTP